MWPCNLTPQLRNVPTRILNLLLAPYSIHRNHVPETQPIVEKRANDNSKNKGEISYPLGKCMEEEIIEPLMVGKPPEEEDEPKNDEENDREKIDEETCFHHSIPNLVEERLDSRTHLFDEWGNDRIQEHKSMKSKLAPQRIKFNFMFNVSSPQSFTKHNWSMTREMAKKGFSSFGTLPCRLILFVLRISCFMFLLIPLALTALFCTFIYAKCSYIEHRQLWNDLITLSTSTSGPWLIGGDFNVVLSASECIDCNLKEVISGDSWNPMAMSTQFPQLDFSHLPISPPVLSMDSDIPVWLSEQKGNFILSSGITLFNSPNISTSFCHMLWNILILLKFTIFMWWLTNHFLALNKIWQLWGDHMASHCHCGKGIDSFGHIFSHCSATDDLWTFVAHRCVVWKKPTLESFVVLNIDGASKGNPNIFPDGGVLWFSAGTFISAFSNFLGFYGTKNATESVACLHGIKLVHDLDFSSLHIQTDSNNVATWLTK
ncbi:hypothetical protein M9H77_02150 [Catharanthus roseus]|uniref:Uncharacterized protein n=1 Tax=Catharanthus roseus TaxID=4058 RepID=A0ACC0C831_CATRO|nr:hypothetical protein M9H77_02150 [Catharanthus roseus]